MSTTNGLNRSQRRAVEHADGPLLVLAGAGTGKTRVISHRIAHLVERRIAAASNILALTFARKAALEMKERVGSMLATEGRRVAVNTFHSLGYRILKEHADAAGLRPDFSVILEGEQRAILKTIRDRGAREFGVTELLYGISRLKSLGEVSQSKPRVLESCLGLYQRELRRRNAVDLDDLCGLAFGILKRERQIREALRNRWQYLLIDEYQDTNRVQYRLMRELLSPKRNVCVVGDDDQSIYGFRGASVELIRRFERDFPGAKVVTLVSSYRSSSEIIGLANQVISRARSRYSKELSSEVGSLGRVRWHRNLDNEEAFIARRIRRPMKSQSLDDTAVLVRSGLHAAQLREYFRRVKIPCRSGPDDESRGLSVMTLHQSKGLEFSTVFMAGVEDDMLPHYHAVKEGPAAVEEERRLFYVGVTRAKHELVISSRAQRNGFRKTPSRFLTELGRSKYISVN